MRPLLYRAQQFRMVNRLEILVSSSMIYVQQCHITINMKWAEQAFKRPAL